MPRTQVFAPISATTKTYTVQVQTSKAFCSENQAALDRLQEALIKAQSQGNNNYLLTIRRAFKSLKECNQPITTQKEALQLKYVGTALARIICPNLTGSGVTPNNPSKKKKAAPKVVVAPERPIRSLHEECSAPIDASGMGPSAKEKAYAKAKQEAETLQLPPKGPWKVILIIDGRERQSKQVVSACKQSGIPCEERHLPIGDMAWIAQCIQPKQQEQPQQQTKPIEIMVGTIIERKEVSDLAGSLYGTRYNEQRLRLSQCGLPQVLFLVEGDVTQVENCSGETLQMAMMETRVLLGFQVVQTKHLTETVRVLKGLHRRIVQRTFPEAFGKTSGVAVPTYATDANEEGPRHNIDKVRRRNRRPSSLLEMVFDTPPVPSFGTPRFITYPELKAKVELDREQGTKSVQAITLAMLKQIPTLSQKKCTAIAQRFPTMNRLLEAMCYGDDDPVKLVQNIPIERRIIGPKSASEVYVACCTLEDGSIVTSKAAGGTEPPTKPSTFARKASAKDAPVEGGKPIASSNTTKNTMPSKFLARSGMSSSEFETSSTIPVPSRKRSAVASAAAFFKGNDDARAKLMETPPRKKPNTSIAKQEAIDLLTPDAKPRAAPAHCQPAPMLSCHSSDTVSSGSLSQDTSADIRMATLRQVNGRNPLSALQQDYSFLLSSPDSPLFLAESLNMQPAMERAAKARGVGEEIRSRETAICHWDSDSDDDDLQKAIRASLAESGNPTSPPARRLQDARNVSNDSSTGSTSSYMSRPEDNSLRERLARKTDMEVIAIDLD
jgi:ERCC4-type nuclease